MLGGEYDGFLECCGKKPRESYRVNTLKAEVEELSDLAAEEIPWCPAGFYSKKPLGCTIEHFLGLIYVEDASSMLPPEVLAPGPEDTVLDLAAAPGGKTTHLAALMGNRGCIIANDPDPRRLKTLRFNLNRLGVANAVVTSSDGIRFKPNMLFDRILLDAPCSNGGQLRDNPEALTTWSKSKVKRCSELQKKLIGNAASMLKKDGVLVYSTCTFSPEENEGVVDHAVEEHGLTIEPVNGCYKKHAGLTEWNARRFAKGMEDTVRLYPHDNDTAGFYLAKLRK